MIVYFARHPTAANLLMLVFVILGLVALPGLRRESYPEFEPSQIRITASYPGADAEIVDETLVQSFEEAIAGLDGVAVMTSQAREGAATITIDVEDAVPLADVLADVKSAVDGVRDLPPDLDPPVVAAATRRAPVASIAVTGPMSAQDLKLYCEQLRRELLRDEHVAQVSIAGFSTHQILIQLKQSALARHGLSVADVAAAVQAQSVDSPIGTIERAGGDILVRYSDKRTDVGTLAELVVKGAAGGAEIRLGEVAKIEDTFAIEEEQTQFNGERACTLGITKTAWQDSLDVLGSIEAFLAEQELRKPTGVKLTLTQNVASAVSDQIGLLFTNAWQGLLLVFVTLWLFFHVRLAFWVAAGLPVSVLGSLWLLGQLGQTVNMMTMMGMLVALGLVMDDAIVLAENFAAHRERGASSVRAAIDSVKEVASGVVSSFLTTVAVFLPLMGIEGRIGRVLQVIPVVLVAVLAVSLVEAFLILPNHLSHTFRDIDPHQKSRARAWFDAGFARFRERRLGGAVDFAVRNRWAVLGGMVAALIVSVGMLTSGRLRYVAFPAAEGDVAEFRLALPPGAPLGRTQQEVDRVVAAAWRVSEKLTPEQPEQQPLVRNVSARFNYNADVTDETGPHLATVSVDLLGIESRTTTLDAFSKAWRAETGPLPSAAVTKFAEGTKGGPAGNAIEVEIQSEDLERATEVSQRIQAWFMQNPGVFDVGDNLDPGSEQVRVRLRPGAGSTGLTGSAVAQQVRSALSGVSVQTFHTQGEDYELYVELEHRGRDTMADLELLPIAVAPGVNTPLGSIATIELTSSFARLNRRDSVRTVTVTGSVSAEEANASELMSRFMAEAAPEIEREFPEVRLAAGGAAKQSAEALNSMLTRMMIGLFAVFALLSLQFRSFVAPLIVMLAIPFAFVGVVWGHLLMGMPLSSQSIFGLIAISGVVVNDSILLMEFINLARVRGDSPVSAAGQASRDRFRAVLLTSATTIAGLFPIMFETSRHAQSLVPVAASIVFGLAASTVLVLIVIPAAYAVLADLGLAPRPYAGDEEE
ncbi:efflux RND transporter permease subunit [Nannocystis sp. SCPEA4]|uniref:efflux RND transporter permease subunit n=1 Tax=Nannocystis sp. SCPEA4 TaxID=2996787 RepID=UPI00226DEBE6|nr:efflux RND transporter permease subunit [Nannocystis sp. SCPEA4]